MVPSTSKYVLVRSYRITRQSDAKSPAQRSRRNSNIPSLWATSLSRQEYSVDLEVKHPSPRRSRTAVPSYHSRCMRHSLPGEVRRYRTIALKTASQSVPCELRGSLPAQNASSPTRSQRCRPSQHAPHSRMFSTFMLPSRILTGLLVVRFCSGCGGMRKSLASSDLRPSSSSMAFSQAFCLSSSISPR